MPIGPKRLRDLLRGVLSDDPEERTSWAATAKDWLGSIDEAEGAAIGVVLLNQVLVEDDREVVEELLHTLATLAESDLVPARYTSGISALDRSDLDPSSREYAAFLQGRHEAAP